MHCYVFEPWHNAVTTVSCSTKKRLGRDPSSGQADPSATFSARQCLHPLLYDLELGALEPSEPSTLNSALSKNIQNGALCKQIAKIRLFVIHKYDGCIITRMTSMSRHDGDLGVEILQLL
jgi:hypothetical protein